VGAHRLRHALATELLAKGAALTNISQVLLRHQDLATTQPSGIASDERESAGRLLRMVPQWRRRVS
jgi:integrase